MTARRGGLRAVGLELFRPILPMLASPGGERRRGDGGVRTRVGGVQARRAPGPDPPPRRRGPDLLAQPQRDHRTPARDRRRRAPRCRSDRLILDGEALWMGEQRPRRFQDTMSQIDADAPPEGSRHVPVRHPAPRRRDLLDAPLSERAAELRRIAPHLAVPSVVTDDVAAAERVLADRCTPATRASSSRTRTRPTPPAGAARRGARSSRSAPTTSSCSGPSGATGAGAAGCRTCTSAARDPATGGFVMVGKSFKGLTDELLRWQTEALLERETDRRGHRGPRRARAGRRDRDRRRPVLDPVSGRRRVALRAGQALPARQERRRGRHDRRAAQVADRRRWSPGRTRQLSRPVIAEE